MLIHLLFMHQTASNNPLGLDKNIDKIPFHPYITGRGILGYTIVVIIQSVPLSTETGISVTIITPVKILQRNLNRSTFVAWEVKRNVSIHEETLHSEKIWCLVWYVPVAHNWSHLLRRSHHNSCIHGNLQHFCKPTGRWGTLNWIFPAEWSDIPHFTRQRGRNSVLFSATASFRRELAQRARPNLTPPDIWTVEFTKTNNEPKTPWKQTSPKKFRWR